MKSDDIHAPPRRDLVFASVVREGARPTDAHAPAPITWVFLIVALALWAGWYLGDGAGGFDSSRMDGDVPARPTQHGGR